MLPGILTSSYSKYKEDTKVFTTWLSQAAAACGYKPTKEEPNDSEGIKSTPADKGVKLTGKARKEAKLRAEAEKAAKRAAKKKKPDSEPRVVKHTITTNDLLQQAELISRSTEKNIEVPTGLRKIIQRAISARKRAAAWFRTTKVNDQSSNDAHEYFIGVLEKALILLEPRLDGASNGKKKDTTGQVEKDEEAILQLSNRYDGLKVEDFEDPEGLEEVITSIEQAKMAPGRAVTDVFELEEESNTMQLSMMIFCFFEDMHAIQEFLGEVWRSYKNKEASLIAASFTTNAAFSLIRRNEEEILKLAPDLFERKRSYETIAMIIYFADAFSKNEDPQAKLKSNESLRPTPFDDFIYLSVSRVLMKFTHFAQFPRGIDNIQYPLPVAPLRFSYITRPELLGTPTMDKKEVEDRLLSQFFIDLQLYNGAKHDIMKYMPGRISPPLDDELLKGLRQLAVDGTVSIWLVFACRIWLDIQEILGDQVHRGYQELLQQAEEVEETLLSTGAFEDKENSIRWLTADADVAQRLMSASGEWILKGFLSFFKRDAISRMRSDLNEPFSIPRDFEGMETSVTIAKPKERGIGRLTFEKFQNEAAKKVDMRGIKPPKDLSFSSLEGSLIRVDKNPRNMTETERMDMHRLLRSKAGVDEEPPSEEHEQNAKRLNFRLIMPHEDENFLFTHNPLYCGNMSFEFAIDAEQTGLSLSNYHFVTSSVAHLYKAVQRSGFVEGQWPQMEQMIAMHKDEIFEGNFPRSSYEAFRRYSKSMRISSSTGRSGPQCKVFSDIFRQYFNRRASLETCLTNTKDLIQENMIQNIESKHKRRDLRRNFTSQQFLAALQEFLPTAVSSITFDYISFLQTCYCLIEEIRQNIENDLGVSMPLRKMYTDSVQPAYLNVASDILQDAKDGNDEKLRVAGRVLNSFMEDPKPRIYVS